MEVLNRMRESFDDAFLNQKLPKSIDFLLRVRERCGSLPIPKDENGIAELRLALGNELQHEILRYKFKGWEADEETPIMKVAKILWDTPIESLRDGELIAAADKAAAQGLCQQSTVQRARTKWLHNSKRKRIQPEVSEPQPEPAQAEPETPEPEAVREKAEISERDGLELLKRAIDILPAQGVTELTIEKDGFKITLSRA